MRYQRKIKFFNVFLCLIMLLATFSPWGIVPNVEQAHAAVDGVSYDTTTKTLTVTASDLSNTSVKSAINTTSYKTYATKIVVNTASDIPASLFQNYTNVTDIVIEKAGDIGEKAFYNVGNTTGLARNITITECGDIGAQSFYRYYGNGGTLTITKCGDIAQKAFYYAKLSGKLTIKECGDIAGGSNQGAFYYSDTGNGTSTNRITDISIGTCGDIGISAFNGVGANEAGATAITLSIDKCGDIGEKAFYSMGKAGTTRDITIGECGDIGTQAFYRGNGAGGTLAIEKCGNLAKQAFHYANVSGTITIKECGDIATNAFYYADTGKSPYVTAIEIGTCGSITNMGTTGMSNLKTLTIDKITGTITGPICGSGTGLTELTIGECGDIPASALYNMTGLETLTIGKCGDIGAQSGVSLKSIKTIKIGECGDIGVFSNATNNYAYNDPETIEIGKCGNIAAAAFTHGTNNNSKLTTLKIGECTSIGKQAFYYSTNLTSLEIGSCGSIGEFAFYCAGSTSTGIPSLTLTDTAVAKNAFSWANIKKLELVNNTEMATQAFYASTIEEVTLNGVKNIGEEAFKSLNGLKTLTVKNIDTIANNTFKVEDASLNAVTNLTLENIGTIGEYAFYNFTKLETVDVKGTVKQINAQAFSGCDSLKEINIADETRLGYSDSFAKLEADYHDNYIYDRVEKILADKFDLVDPTAIIEEIKPEGWTSVKEGTKNSASNIGDTQMSIEAKWADEDLTTADVLLKAYYTTTKQMDIVFVADCSNSMARFGSSEAMNANFYNMQSKLLDVTNELLSSKDVDSRVAFATFGENESSKSKFFDDASEAEDYIWNEIVNYNSNTNYSSGFKEALELVKANKAAGRDTTVIFISDGEPYGWDNPIPEDYYGVAQAQAIRDEGVEIISVLQQVPASKLASAEKVMKDISDQVFSSTDVEGFSTAVNSAMDYSLSSYTLTTTVNPEFTLIEDSIKVSTGETEVSKDKNGNTVIKWKITDVPFEELTMSYSQTLNKVGGSYPYGNFDTQKGLTTLSSGTTLANSEQTPVLSRPSPDADDPSDNSSSGGDTNKTGIKPTLTAVKKKAADTGDDQNLILFGGLLILTGAGTALAICRRKTDRI